MSLHTTRPDWYIPAAVTSALAILLVGYGIIFGGPVPQTPQTATTVVSSEG